MSNIDLSKRQCQPCAKGTPPLGTSEIQTHLAQLTGWEVVQGELVKRFAFKNYYETMAFVNAAAWVSHHADHHPDIELGYNQCRLRYITHDIGGLSENDFICAAKMDALFDL